MKRDRRHEVSWMLISLKRVTEKAGILIQDRFDVDMFDPFVLLGVLECVILRGVLAASTAQ
jgi:hypothetical protein